MPPLSEVLPALRRLSGIRVALGQAATAFKVLLCFSAVVAIVLAVLGGAGYGLYLVYRSYSPRTLSVCIATDPTFRVGKPDWEYRVGLWFAEANRAFAGAGVIWRTTVGGDVQFPPDSTLDQRRILLDQWSACKGDLVLGLTGTSDSATSAAVYPFAHTLLLAAPQSDSDATIVIRLTRSLSHVFGVPANADALVATDTPQGDLVDGKALAIISRMRGYDLARGTSVLPGRWERRAFSALIEALPGDNREKTVQAHRLLARAFAAGRNFPLAVNHLREAVKGSPGEALLRMELALSLQDDSEIDSAVEELKRAATLSPVDARPHALLGAAYRRQTRAYEAIAEFRTAVKLDATTPEYFAALADALSLQVGRAEETTAALETALRLNPRDSASLQKLEEVRRARLAAENDLQAAEAEARRSPQSPTAQLQLGMAEIEASHADRALSAFRRVVALDGSNGYAHLSLSRLYFDRGEYGTAGAELAAAQRLGIAIPQGFATALRAKLGGAVAPK